MGLWMGMWIGLWMGMSMGDETSKGIAVYTKVVVENGLT